MKTKKIVALLLAMAMLLVVVMSGCGNDAGNTSTDPTDVDVESSSTVEAEPSEVEPEDNGEEEGGEDEEFDVNAYTDESSAIYDAVFGEYQAAYQKAVAEVLDNDLRQALMAIAEAKFLEAAGARPTFSSGGNYRMTRVAPYTYGYADWSGEGGNYEKCVVTTEPIKLVDYDALCDYWKEHRGDGTYIDYCKTYLTEQGYTFKDSMAVASSSDPQTWDQGNTSRAADGQYSTQSWDPLYSYNAEGVQAPAMAESYDVSEDGLTYTFHLRPGMNWVDSQGRVLGPVTADDWVAGMQHVLDAKAGLETLLEGVIVNADAYNNGDITDFSQVGVKAEDDLTLVYTLPRPVPYFMSMLGYSIFMPLNRSFYESMGGTFGAEFEEGSYGQDADSIAYCGPYTVSNWTKESICTYTANPEYWDYDNINCHQFSYTFNDGSDTTKSYTDFQSGVTDLQTLNASTLEIAKSENFFDDYVHTTLTGGTTYMSWINTNRKAYANFNDASAVVSKMTEEQKATTNAYSQNVHFRRALLFAIDMIGYRAQTAGDDLAALAIRNSYVPSTFYYLENEVTVDINGAATTFPAGTAYGEICQAQLDADGVPIKAWDAEAGTGDGYDGWYNPEYAMSELQKAIEEVGIEVTTENPIVINTPNNASVETANNQANFLKQNMEDSLGGLVRVDLVDCVDSDEYYYSGYYCEAGYQANFNLFLGSGWGPDYADPQTFHDTLLPDYSGYMTMLMGMF